METINENSIMEILDSAYDLAITGVVNSISSHQGSVSK